MKTIYTTWNALAQLLSLQQLEMPAAMKLVPQPVAIPTHTGRQFDHR
jgi:hypothetical protein